MSTWKKWPTGGPGDEAQGVYDAWCAFTDSIGMEHEQPDDYRGMGSISETFEFRWLLKEKRWAVLTVTAEWDADFDGERMVGRCIFQSASITEVWE